MGFENPQFPIPTPKAVEAPRARKSEQPFGSKEEQAATLELLENGEVKILGSWEEVYPQHFKKHTNQVEVARVNPTRNGVTAVAISGGGSEEIYAIFKPFDGENRRIRETRTYLPNFYHEEVAGYVYSDHFNLGVVPPTVKRAVDDASGEKRIGSLQLCMDPNRFISMLALSEVLSIEDWDKVCNSDPFLKIALLHTIIADIDGHLGNVLVEAEEENGKYSIPEHVSAASIDHGMSGDTRGYIDIDKSGTDLEGPSLLVSVERTPTKELTRKKPVSSHLLELLADGLQRKDELEQRLLTLHASNPEYDRNEISYSLQRTKAILDTGIFLTKRNTIALPPSAIDPEHPHPRFSSTLDELKTIYGSNFRPKI